MTHAINKILKGEARKTTTIETTYRYVPILGNFIGLWRKVSEKQIGDHIDVMINGHLSEQDCFFVNGIEVKLPKEVYHP